jgi:Bacterial regulatory helix-turn-helix protein, lysR family
MELRHVRSFLSLTKPLSFSRTAEIVHLSQSALSLQIQSLEEEIGREAFRAGSEKDRSDGELPYSSPASREDQKRSPSCECGA